MAARQPAGNEATARTRSRTVAGLLAIFLGGLGAHRFYLGRFDGLLYLLLSILGLWIIVFPFCVIQGLIYLLASDERWARISGPRTETQVRRGRRHAIIGGGIVALGLVGLVVYLGVREEQAKSDAHAFCDAVSPGDPMDPVKARAEGLGMGMLRQITDEKVVVGFVGIPPYSRHLCTVRAGNGRVTDASYFYMD